jgi:Zn-dependent peptidase ImmA (M78 family)
MSSTYAEIEDRIQQAIEYIKENPDAKRATVARDFDVSSQRLRFRLLEKSLASAVREVHDRRLKLDQNLALVLYIRKLITFDLNSRLNVIKSAAMKLLMQNASESASFLLISHA